MFRPYLIDLETETGTFINAERIESNVYVELHPKDIFQCGDSSREYVLLHDAMPELLKAIEEEHANKAKAQERRGDNEANKDKREKKRT